MISALVHESRFEKRAVTVSDLFWLTDAQMARLREALKDKGKRACIPGRKQRKKPVKYDRRRYKRRNRIEIMFGMLKDWRRVATRYDRCPKFFLSAVALAALAIYWLRDLTLKDEQCMV